VHQAFDSGRTVRAVSISFTSTAKEKIAAEPRFKEDSLLAEVEGELRARKLLDGGNSLTNPTVEISINDFTTRSTTNAVLFGYNMGAGALAADILVRDADGKEVRDFQINANSRLATRASGEDGNPLRSLYRRFAILVAENLAGSPSRSVKSSDGEMPR
jgi:hypothetical protein